MSVPLGRQGGKERAACEMVGPNVFTYTHTHTHKFTHTHTHIYCQQTTFTLDYNLMWRCAHTSPHAVA